MQGGGGGRGNVPLREKVDIDALMATAVGKIQACFAKMGWSPEAVTAEKWKLLQVSWSACACAPLGGGGGDCAVQVASLLLISSPPCR